MRCYHCGARLSEHNFCTACKSDVTVYKQVVFTANIKYNSALDKANVRNLSAAKEELREVLAINQGHIEARNLLGLILFETGEVFAALKEWIISRSYEEDKNIANDYILKLQGNANKLDDYARSVRKYNLALSYCMQDSKDLAIIQLKKVILMNCNFLEAKLLLALIHMEALEWTKAHKLVAEVLKVDTGNIKARSYMQKIKGNLRTKNNMVKEKATSTRKEVDNELIIQPMKVHEPSVGVSSKALVGFVIGTLLGVCAMMFLVFPGQIQMVRTESEKQLRIANESLDAQGVTIIDLEAKLQTLEKQTENYNDDYVSLLGENVNAVYVEKLMIALQQYILYATDVVTYSSYIDACIEGADYYKNSPDIIKNTYLALIEATGPTIGKESSDQGMAAYYRGDYDTAIELLERAILYNPENVDDLYYLGNVYRDAGEKSSAIETYQKVIELFPDTEKALWADTNINNF